jgi:CRISPR-associated endonuclease/helicase Cas3
MPKQVDPDDHRFFAHSLEGEPLENWEPLEDHLFQVAARAADFASAWRAERWGFLAGLWHDLGKYSFAFRDYLLTENGYQAHIEQPGRVDHSTAGARHAREILGPTQRIQGDLLAYCIAGHHAGLPDHRDEGGCSGLFDRLEKRNHPIDAPPREIATGGESPSLRVPFRPTRLPYQLAFFTRMLFSCLVDADFLATEQFMNRDRASRRVDASPDWLAWDRKLTDHIDGISRDKAASRRDAPLAAELQRVRSEVLVACRTRSADAPGLFSLAVPTGGGKTLASLSFAVRHAIAHNLRRIIYAIPFTSIIEQAADEFRSALNGLGDHVILEHHVNLDPKKETPWSRLASENWDAPLIVTTNVQLFESLHAARTSSCRKLHRLANSVIILDEVQTLPVELLAPCLAALDELARNYGCTVVLCSATRPAFESRADFKIGLRGEIREIAPEPSRLSARIRRVAAERLGAVDDDALANRLRAEDQALCIVNTRPHAARLFIAMNTDPIDKSTPFHLSTRLCGEHRSRVLRRIREQLKRGEPCRVVSTQLVEAGVDLDFPSVYRALAGVDAMVQAAGRCNREGRRVSGQLFVFEPIDVALPRGLESMIESAREVLPDHADLLGLETVDAFFRLHYAKHKDRTDKAQVLDPMTFAVSASGANFKFRTVAADFRMIDDAGVPIIVPYRKTGRFWVDRVQDPEPLKRDDYRQLQRYTVSVPQWVFASLHDRGSLAYDETSGRPAILLEQGLYDDHLGLRVDDLADNPRDPADFIR